MRMLLPLVALLVAVAPLMAQDDAVLFSADFETDMAGIATMDPEAHLSITNDANTVYAGKGSLQITFPQRAISGEGEDMILPGALLYPMAVPPVGLKAISFSVCVRKPTALAVSLGEGEDGPRYMKLVWCDGDEWDDVVLPVSELMPDNDGPADPDGKLSPEHLSALVFIDLGGAFRSGIENGPFVFEPLGEQTIWLDDLKLLSEDPSPQKPEVAENVTVLNHYDAPLTGALIMGGEDRTVDYDDGDPEGDCLKLTYALSGNTIIALAQPVARGALKDAASVRLKVKASAQTQLVIALGETPDAPNLEETSYAYVEQIEAAAGWKELDIPVSRFQLDVGKHDPDGKLTLEKVQSVVIADASAMMAGQRVSNTLWLDELAVVR